MLNLDRLEFWRRVDWETVYMCMLLKQILFTFPEIVLYNTSLVTSWIHLQCANSAWHSGEK